MGVSRTPLVGVIMGSTSDYDTMAAAVQMLDRLGIAHETKVVSAHRTPELMVEYAKTAEARGLEVIVAGAGGAAHLPGMVASLTLLPVIGVPVVSRALSGVDSLLSIAQMPAGVPVATVAIGNAKNGALLAARIVARNHAAVYEALAAYSREMTATVAAADLPTER